MSSVGKGKDEIVKKVVVNQLLKDIEVYNLISIFEFIFGFALVAVGGLSSSLLFLGLGIAVFVECLLFGIGINSRLTRLLILDKAAYLERCANKSLDIKNTLKLLEELKL